MLYSHSPHWGVSAGGCTMTVSRSARGQRSDKRLVAIAVAAGILLAACGDDSDGTGGTSDIGDGVAARNAEMEAASSANITQWDGCDVFSDHMHEFAEFLGYLRFDRDLQSGNGDATSGILMCYGDAVVAEDDALEAMDFEV